MSEFLFEGPVAFVQEPQALFQGQEARSDAHLFVCLLMFLIDFSSSGCITCYNRVNF